MIRLQAVVISLALLAFSSVACSEPNPAEAKYVPEDCECAEERAEAGGTEVEEPALATAGFSFGSAGEAEDDVSDEPSLWPNPTTEDEPEAGSDTPAEDPEQAGDGAAKKDENGLSGQINLNTASMNELMLLPGVGPALAERIVSYREKRDFTRTIHLKRVRGIGDATYAKMKSYLRVDGSTTLRE